MQAEIFGMDAIVVLIVVVVFLFGGAAIPKLARNLVSARNESDKGLQDGKGATSAAAVPPVDGADATDAVTASFDGTAAERPGVRDWPHAA